MSGDTTTVSQAVSSAGTATLTDVTAGDTYSLGALNVTNVVVSEGSVAKALDTDYLLNAASGQITILSGGTIATGDDLSITWDQPAATVQKVRGGVVASPVYKLTYQADDANTEGNAAQDKLTVWKVSVASDGDMQFISDDYSSFSLRFAVLSDSNNHPTEPFFTLERV
jgi:hypothetical protein